MVTRFWRKGLIVKLPLPIFVKGIWTFLGHAGFYHRFIKNFFKFTHFLCNLLEKEMKFIFDDEWLKAFEELKEKMISTLIIVSLDWLIPFKVMCDASSMVLGTVLGQRWAKILYPICYTSKTLNPTPKNYILTK